MVTGILYHKLNKHTHCGGFVLSSDDLHTKYIIPKICLTPTTLSPVKWLDVPINV